MSAITFMPLQRLSPSDLLAFSQLNSSLICEMNTNGSIILKTPLYHKFSQIALKILEKLQIWNEKGSEGVVLDMKTGFVLSNGAIRHPSVSWVKPYKISSQTEHLIESAPDFYVEFLTESDNSNTMKMRMKEYMLNGSLLGWLIDVNNEKVYIYKNDGTEQVVENFQNMLSGGSILRGFEVILQVKR